MIKIDYRINIKTISLSVFSVWRIICYRWRRYYEYRWTDVQILRATVVNLFSVVSVLFFQTDDLLIIEVLPKMEADCLRLASLKYHPGIYMQEFLEKYSQNTSYFGNVKLSGPCPEVDLRTRPLLSWIKGWSYQHVFDIYM